MARVEVLIIQLSGLIFDATSSSRFSMLTSPKGDSRYDSKESEVINDNSSSLIWVSLYISTSAL